MCACVRLWVGVNVCVCDSGKQGGEQKRSVFYDRFGLEKGKKCASKKDSSNSASYIVELS